jgi:hypothetical protein
MRLLLGIVSGLLGALGCASPSSLDAVDQATGPDAQKVAAQIADPGTELFTVPASLGGVETWTGYLGDAGMTVTGRDHAGKVAALYAWQLDPEGNAGDAECAVSPALGVDCAEVARKLTSDLDPPGGPSATIRPSSLPPTTPSTPNLDLLSPAEVCRRVLSRAAVKLIGPRPAFPQTQVLCNTSVAGGWEIPAGHRVDTRVRQNGEDLPPLDDTHFPLGGCLLFIPSESGQTPILGGLDEGQNLAAACCAVIPQPDGQPARAPTTVRLLGHPVQLVCR